MKKPATISKEVPKPKRPTGVGDTRNLVRTGKPQVAPTEQITTAPVPLEPKSKNISLNNSKLNPSPSRSRTVAGNTAAKEDLTGMSYDRILMGSVGNKDDWNTQTGMAIGVMSPLAVPKTPPVKEYGTTLTEKRNMQGTAINSIAAKGSMIKLTYSVEEPHRLTERRRTFEGEPPNKAETTKEDVLKDEEHHMSAKKTSTGMRIHEIMKEDRVAHLGDYNSARAPNRPAIGSSIGPSINRNHGNGVTSLTGLKDLPSYITGTAEALGVSTPQPASHHSRGSLTA